MKVTICTNTETLRPIWGDIYEDAGFAGYYECDELIAAHWVKAFVNALPAYWDFEYESNFAYWHGGPGQGTYHTNDRAGEVTKAAETADLASRIAAREDVAALAETE